MGHISVFKRAFLSNILTIEAQHYLDFCVEIPIGKIKPVKEIFVRGKGTHFGAYCIYMQLQCCGYFLLLKKYVIFFLQTVESL